MQQTRRMAGLARTQGLSRAAPTSVFFSMTRKKTNKRNPSTRRFLRIQSFAADKKGLVSSLSRGVDCRIFRAICTVGFADRKHCKSPNVVGFKSISHPNWSFKKRTSLVWSLNRVADCSNFYVIFMFGFADRKLRKIRLFSEILKNGGEKKNPTVFVKQKKNCGGRH